MTESTTLDRNIGAEVLRELEAAYLFDLSLPVRPPTKDEQALYARRDEDGTYAALLTGTADTELPGPGSGNRPASVPQGYGGSAAVRLGGTAYREAGPGEPDEPDAFEGTGWTQAEVDAALAGNARRSYEEAGRPDDVPPAGADPS